ncbi:MAG TPA: hypothetical protein VK506_08700 [Conexibacter sp.]|nr:hypothetical protein [Conexibacter sp.]
MTAPQLRKFTLVVDTQAEPIAGRVEDEGSSAREFVGWLGLATALEAFVSRRPAEGDRSSPVDPPATGGTA